MAAITHQDYETALFCVTRLHECEDVEQFARTVSGRLTVREVEVLLQVEQGKTNDEVAAALDISTLTVRTHLEHILEKLHVPSRTAAVTRFRRLCGGFNYEADLECW